VCVCVCVCVCVVRGSELTPTLEVSVSFTAQPSKQICRPVKNK